MHTIFPKLLVELYDQIKLYPKPDILDEYIKNIKDLSFISENVIDSDLPSFLDVHEKELSSLYYLGENVFFDGTNNIFYIREIKYKVVILDKLIRDFHLKENTIILITVILLTRLHDKFVSYVKDNFKDICNQYLTGTFDYKDVSYLFKIMIFIILDLTYYKEPEIIINGFITYKYAKDLFSVSSNIRAKIQYNREKVHRFGIIFEYFGNIEFSRKIKYTNQGNELFENPNLKIEEDLPLIEDVLNLLNSFNINYKSVLNREIYIDEICDIIHFYNGTFTYSNVIINEVLNGDTSVQRILKIIDTKGNRKNLLDIYEIINNNPKFNLQYENYFPDNFTKNIELFCIKHVYTKLYIIQHYGFMFAEDSNLAMSKLFSGIKTIFVPKKERKCNPEEDKDGFNLNLEGEDIFAIGTYDNYSCYEVTSVKSLMETKGYLYYDYTINQDGSISYLELTIEEAKNLVKLLRLTVRGSANFIKLINEYIAMNRESWYQDFENLSNKEIIKDFFLGMFNIGMLIRRWIPTDKEYPMKEEGTRHGDRGISEQAISFILTENFELFRENTLDKIRNDKKLSSFINKLTTYNKYNGIVETERYNTQGNIFVLIKRVFEAAGVKDLLCQRTGSNIFITTADYYLKRLFNYTIPQFDINELQNIA